MLLMIGLLFVIIFTVFITSLLDLKSKLSTILSWYLLGMANVILVAELSGLFNRVNNKWFFIGFHFLLTIIAVSIWWRTGKPRLFPPVEKSINFKNISQSLKSDPLLWVLVIGVVFIYLLNAFIITRFHANTNDSLAVHLARIGYWLQFGSFRPWPTENIYQVTYPFNAQVQMLWTILLSGTDQLVEFVQWFSAVFGVVAITGISQLIGYTRKQGLFAGLIWSTFPMVLLQSTTTQNDLIVASVILIGIYFLFFGIKNQDNQHIILSGLAFGLSFGIKQTAFFVIPGVGGAFILFYLKYKQKILKPLLIFACSTLIAFLLLGSYIYINNLIPSSDAVTAYDSNQKMTPFGPSEYVSENMGLDTIEQIKDSFWLNPARYLYQSADPTGIPFNYRGYFTDAREKVAALLFGVLQIPVESEKAIEHHNFSLSNTPIIHEDTAWFGVLGFFLVFLALFEAPRSIKKKNVFSMSLFLISLSVTFSILFFRNSWTPHQGRYMLTVFSCLTPFYASIYQSDFKKKNLVRIFIIFSIVIFALISSRTIILDNSGKPLRWKNIVLNGTRLQHYRFSSGQLWLIVDFVDDNVPEDAVLGLAIGRSWEYPYFKEGFTRKLVPIYPIEQLDNKEWLSEQNINFILLNTAVYKITDAPTDFDAISYFDGYLIFKRVR